MKDYIKTIFLIIFLFLLPFQIYFNIYKSITLSIDLILGFTLVFLYKKEIIKSLQDRNKNIFNLSKLLFILFLVFTFISLFKSINFRLGLQFFGHYLIGFLFIILFSTIEWNKLKTKYLLLSFLTAGFIFSIFLIIFYFRNKWEIAFLRNELAEIFIDKDSLKNLLTIKANIRLPNRSGVFFGNTNFAALFLGLYIPLLLILIININNIFIKIISILTSIIFITGLFSTGSRAGLLSFIIILMTFLFIHIIKKRKIIINIKFIIGIITIIIFFIIILKLDMGVFNRLKVHKLNPKGRFAMYKTAIKINKEKFFAGYGADLGKWKEAEEKVLGRQISPHNIFLEEWGRSGIFAALCLLLFYMSILYKGVKMILKGNNHILLLAAFLSILWIFIQINLTNNIFTKFRIYMPIYMYIGIIQYFYSKNIAKKNM